MTIWIDVHISPAIAPWLHEKLGKWAGGQVWQQFVHEFISINCLAG